MFLLDTNVLSEIRKIRIGRAQQPIVDWEAGVNAPDLYLSVATIQEIEFGILQLERKDAGKASVLRAWMSQGVLSAFRDRILVVDTAVAQRAAYLHTLRTRSDADALIAATAYIHNMPVVTRNVTGFHDTGVRLINPWISPPAETKPRLKLGTALYEVGKKFGGVDLDIRRDPTPVDAPGFGLDIAATEETSNDK